MNIYAIGKKYPDKDIEIRQIVSPLYPSFMFTSPVITAIKKYRVELNQAFSLFPNHELYEEVFIEHGFYIHIHQRNDVFCFIITDTHLTKYQLHWLSTHLLEENIPLDTIAETPESYLCDFKVKQAQDLLVKTKETMTDNFMKVMDRGDKLDALLQQSEKLVEEGEAFKTHARKINSRSCWPDWTGYCTIL